MRKLFGNRRIVGAVSASLLALLLNGAPWAMAQAQAGSKGARMRPRR